MNPCNFSVTVIFLQFILEQPKIQKTTRDNITKSTIFTQNYMLTVLFASNLFPFIKNKTLQIKLISFLFASSGLLHSEANIIPVLGCPARV